MIDLFFKTCVNLRRPHVFVSEKFLNGADVIMIFKQMRSKTSSKDMPTSVFFNSEFSDRSFHAT